MSSAFRQAEERRKAEREAQRREEALEAKREEARERDREEAREAERRAAARAEAEAERKAAEKAAARRAAALAHRRAEAAALRQEQVRAARRAEERAAARREERRAAARDEQSAEERRQASRDEEREQRRADERADERRAGALEQQRAEDREQRRADERRAAALEQQRAEQREQRRADERRAAALEQQRAEDRRQAARVDQVDQQRERERRERERAEQRGQERREQARAERREEERRRDRAEQRRDDAVAQRRDEVRAQQRRTAVRTSTLDARRAAERGQARAAEVREAALIRRAAAGDGGDGGGTGPRGGSGWLRAVGRTVVDESGAPVVLRGVTVHALERPEPDGEAFAPAFDADDAALMAAWGCTTVTVPIAQDLALEGRDDAWGEDYLTALDATVATATAAGLRAIVQLSLLSSELPSAPGRFAPPVPDAASIDLWAQVARRYADEPGVLFDLFATPHDPDPGDWTALVMPRLTWPIWERWVLAMVGEIKRVHPRALAIVRGLGGSDLSGFPLPYADGSRIPNLVYAAELAGDPTASLAALRRLARRAPVAASPWRAGACDGRAVEVLGRRLADLGAHWTAARWREPEAPLATEAAGTLAPTPLGRAFQVALAQPPPASSLRAPRVGPVRT